MSDPESPATILDRAADTVLGELRAQDPARYGATANAVRRILDDGTLATHLTPKALAAIARELLDSLPPEGDGSHAD
jgi:hypothetical protein